MNEFIHNSVFLGVTISFAAYGIGLFLRNKINTPLCNPLVISIIITIAVVVVFLVVMGGIFLWTNKSKSKTKTNKTHQMMANVLIGNKQFY